MPEYPPGPPPIPRCSECNTVPDIRRGRYHPPECERGKANEAHAANVRAVEDALREAVNERRQDREFMARLADRVAMDKAILDKLAGLDV